MLIASDLNGPILDMANSAALNLTRAADSAAPAAPTPGSPAPAGSSPFLTDILATAAARAEAEKRKATWLLVGVGVGALVVGILVGRYAIPARKKRKG
jgi:hypothetical protein